MTSPAEYLRYETSAAEYLRYKSTSQQRYFSMIVFGNRGRMARSGQLSSPANRPFVGIAPVENDRAKRCNAFAAMMQKMKFWDESPNHQVPPCGTRCFVELRIVDVETPRCVHGLRAHIVIPSHDDFIQVCKLLDAIEAQYLVLVARGKATRRISRTIGIKWRLSAAFPLNLHGFPLRLNIVNTSVFIGACTPNDFANILIKIKSMPQVSPGRDCTPPSSRNNSKKTAPSTY